eukprot:1150602-Heterocapsa_arctica.AAC.1
MKAGHWNDYLISTLGYAPQLASPSLTTMATFNHARSVFFPTQPWARATAISCLGPYCRIPGAPKCPRAVTDA